MAKDNAMADMNALSRGFLEMLRTKEPQNLESSEGQRFYQEQRKELEDTIEEIRKEQRIAYDQCKHLTVS